MLLFFTGLVVGVAIGMVLMAALTLASMISRMEEENGRSIADVAVAVGDGGDGGGAAAAEQLKEEKERADFYMDCTARNERGAHRAPLARPECGLRSEKL